MTTTSCAPDVGVNMHIFFVIEQSIVDEKWLSVANIVSVYGGQKATGVQAAERKR